jgi:hypothetical protein
LVQWILRLRPNFRQNKSRKQTSICIRGRAPCWEKNKKQLLISDEPRFRVGSAHLLQGPAVQGFQSPNIGCYRKSIGQETCSAEISGTSPLRCNYYRKSPFFVARVGYVVPPVLGLHQEMLDRFFSSRKLVAQTLDRPPDRLTLRRWPVLK